MVVEPKNKWCKFILTTQKERVSTDVVLLLLVVWVVPELVCELSSIKLVCFINGRKKGPVELTVYSRLYSWLILASYPGPAQLSVACSTEKRGKPGISSHVSVT